MNSITRARNFFLYEARYYCDHMIWFRTVYRKKDGDGLTEALALPPPTPDMKRVGVILPGAVPTHLVTNPNDGKNYEARLMVEIQGSQGYVDPFDFRYGKFLISSPVSTVSLCQWTF